MLSIVANVMVKNPHELLIEYAIIYVLCFLGLLTKDSKHAKDHKQKLDVRSTLACTITTTILMAAVRSIFDYKKLNDAVWLFLCYFAGMWSREILCMLTNTKITTIILKAYTKKTIKNINDELSDKDKDTIDEAIDSITDKMNDIKSSNPPGEFDYDSIIDIYK